ncbi:MAG TPA: hypothetical protein ENI90_09205, partial [Methylothermaceae bacterium]|nr:hypothetical protein [Methylothermaceae bacterium]
MIHSPAESLALVPRPDLTPVQVQRELPWRLSFALERIWLEDLGDQIKISEKHKGGDVGPETRIIQIHEVKYGSDTRQSFHLLNMQNVISSLRDSNHSLVYAVRGKGPQVRLYMGVRSFATDTPISTEEIYHVLRRALHSNYPGIVLSQKALYLQDYERDLLDPIRYDHFLRGITGIPSLKGQDPTDFFAQRIDRLVDALRGETYTLLVLAEPIVDRHLMDFTARVRHLSEAIHQLARATISKSEGKSQTTTKTSGESSSLGLGLFLAPLFGPSINHSIQQS